jgi:translocation and assembly module TamA
MILKGRLPAAMRGPGGVLIFVFLAGCASDDISAPLTFEPPASAVSYDVEVAGAPTAEIGDLLTQSLALYRRQEAGAQSLAFLDRRARDDVGTVKTVLRSFGYFEPAVNVTVTPPPAQDATAFVRLAIDPGRPFILTRHDLLLLDAGDVPPPGLDARELGSPVGKAAAAKPILDAEDAAVARLRTTGRPYAERRGRAAVADMDAAELEVDTRIFAGPYYVFGAPQIEGLERVEADYVRTYQTWEEGEPFDERKLIAFQRALIETGLFNSGTVRAPDEPPEGAATPVIVTLSEGKRRTVSAGVRFSSDIGPAVRGAFEHRNLFGANETIFSEAIVGLEEQSLSTRYTVPQFERPGQDFVAGLSLRHSDNDAFEETAATLTAGLQRDLTSNWRAGAGGLLEVSETRDANERTTFTLAGLPVFSTFDNSDDLLNPTRGTRLRADFTPFVGYASDGNIPAFLRFDSTASQYVSLTSDGHYVLAGRARFGSIVTESIDDVPAGRRLYSGGGGSVRGFSERSIGPRDANNDPTGGLSVLELGAEFRARAWGDLGFVTFLEGGAVNEEAVPTFSDGIELAAGAGLRYFSPVGPIRFDLAFPLNPRDGDDSFQFYISIGQAF